MDAGLQSFITFLTILWFFVYWILGGVFFAVMALLRLGRVRKVRFSCLFTFLAAGCAFGSSYFGVHYAKTAIQSCLVDSVSKAQTKIAIIGCGFGGIMGAFLIGTIILTLGGFLIMSISKSKAKPWIILDEEEPTEGDKRKEDALVQELGRRSKFF